jgi:NMD protein affecting ribosome stability and mRNA decay
MRSHKPYTNTTFTKRVDHDGGRHRGPRAPKEPRLCDRCGAVYVRRRWRTAELAGTALDGRDPIVTRCPACRQIASGPHQGTLVVRGAFLDAHRDEIEHLLRNEADRAAADNPLARIMAWETPADDGLRLRTTTEHLAQRLGHALHKAYGGDVQYRFSHENKVADVLWLRD